MIGWGEVGGERWILDVGASSLCLLEGLKFQTLRSPCLKFQPQGAVFGDRAVGHPQGPSRPDGAQRERGTLSRCEVKRQEERWRGGREGREARLLSRGTIIRECGVYPLICDRLRVHVCMSLYVCVIVVARQELDLKVGVAFSRFQTRYFQVTHFSTSIEG